MNPLLLSFVPGKNDFIQVRPVSGLGRTGQVMDIRFQNPGPENWQAEAAIALCPEGMSLPEHIPVLDQVCPWLTVAPALRDFHGKSGELAVFHGFPDLKLPRVIAAGLGKLEDISLRDIRGAVASAARKCRDLGLNSALFPVSQLDHLPGGRDRLIQETVFAFMAGLYQFSQLKTKRDGIKTGPRWLALGLDQADQTGSEDARRAARLGESDAEALAMARDLANTPGNLLYPEVLAAKAEALAQEYGFKCTVLVEEKLEQEGAGCLLAVGRGSEHGPRLIVLEHAPEGASQEKPLVLVGKGLTFDSGGLCLKPAANMGQMKCDMSGAAAVLAAVTAAARENTPHRIVGILTCAENMPGGKAYRPGDVLASMKGETVEVVNTDAEGRLALADALTYAQRHWTPAAIVDIATLTGACAVALGCELAGLFCDDDNLARRIAAFGAATGENYWRMPLWAGYEDSLKSEVADIKHTGAREGGAITAALFLKNFITPGHPWAHLDIAGVDWSGKNTPLCPEGAAAFGTRTLLALCRGGAL